MKNINIDLSSMSDAEKQALIKEKFRECTRIKIEEKRNAKEVLDFHSDDLKPIPVLIPIEAGHKSYYHCCDHILYYDADKDVWREPVPDNYHPDLLTYEDFKVVGSHLYVIFYRSDWERDWERSQKDLNQHAIYYLDVENDTWHHVVNCNVNNEFTDNNFIKAHIVKGIDIESGKMRDTIQWIEMR